MTKQRWLVLAALLFAMLLAGAVVWSLNAKVESPPVFQANEPASTAPTSASNMLLLPEVRAKHPWRIAFIPKFKLLGKTGKLSAYWQPAWEGAKKAGDDYGVTVSLVTSPVLGNEEVDYVEPQIRLVAELTKDHTVDALVIAVFDSNRLAPVINKAVSAGIPVLTLDTRVNTDRVLSFIAYDNYAAGAQMGQWVVHKLNGRGKVLLLDGPQDQQGAVDRRKGLLAGLRSGNVEVLNTKSGDWETVPAHQITTQWLQQYPAVDAILAANDNMAMGTVQAIEQAHRTSILVTGFDANDAALQAIAKGQMGATIDLAPGVIAHKAVQMMVHHLETREKFPAVVSFSDVTLVTQVNGNTVLNKH